MKFICRDSQQEMSTDTVGCPFINPVTVTCTLLESAWKYKAVQRKGSTSQMPVIKVKQVDK